MNKYKILEIVGEGAYGIVYKCENIQTGSIVAIKKFKEVEEELQHTMIRELNCVEKIKHENIVGYIESFEINNILFIVFEYVEKTLLEVLKSSENGLHPSLIKKYVYQMCKAVNYLHQQNIIHRDVKPENLLINPNNDVLKLCDFGFARQILPSTQKITDYVATRWYRAPELLITGGYYGIEVDYWAIGCIMGELVDGQPLFPGDNELDQINKIQSILGKVPDDQIEAFNNNPIYRNKMLDEVDEEITLKDIYGDKLDNIAIDFMKGLLELDPKKRLSGDKVFNHPYLKDFQMNSNSKSTSKRKKLNLIKDDEYKIKSYTTYTKYNNTNQHSPENKTTLYCKDKTIQTKGKGTPVKIKKYHQTYLTHYSNDNDMTYKKTYIPKTMNIHHENKRNLFSKKMIVQLKPLRVKEIHNLQTFNNEPYTTQIYFPSITNNKFYLSKRKTEDSNTIERKKGIKFKDVPNLPKIYKMNKNSLYFSNLMSYINIISN